MIAYRATLPVSDGVFEAVVRLIRDRRRVFAARPRRWKRSCRDQAILFFRVMLDGARIADVGRDIGLGKSQAYHYFHHASEAVAAEAPDLADVLNQARKDGWTHLKLDGTLIPTTRLREKNENGYDAWYSGKHKRHGGNLQVLTDPWGDPVWVSPVEPGSTHDITCARRHVFPALNHAAATWLPVLTDQGYRGADIGYVMPVRKPDMHPADRAHDRYIAAIRSIGERGNAILKGSWRILQRVSLDPRRITILARAALVLTQLEKRYAA